MLSLSRAPRALIQSRPQRLSGRGATGLHLERARLIHLLAGGTHVHDAGLGSPARSRRLCSTWSANRLWLGAKVRLRQLEQGTERGCVADGTADAGRSVARTARRPILAGAQLHPRAAFCSGACQSAATKISTVLWGRECGRRLPASPTMGRAATPALSCDLLKLLPIGEPRRDPGPRRPTVAGTAPVGDGL